jgi:hypothetical protein
VYTFASGDIYSGDRKHGSRDGFGEYIWATGEKCVGSWVNNKKMEKQYKNQKVKFLR